MKSLEWLAEHRGKRIWSLVDLVQLVDEKRAIILAGHDGVSGRQGYQPAAWVIHFSGARLLIHFRVGMYLYERSDNAKSKQTDAKKAAAKED